MISMPKAGCTIELKSPASLAGTQAGRLPSDVGKSRVMTVTDSAITSVPNYIRPLQDTRWNDLVEKHPHATIFHTAKWLEALRRTYDYEPIAATTSSAGSELRNGLVLCSVNSWLTGCRLVSLPFSDHCDPLVDDEAELQALLSTLGEQLREEKLRYLEIRSERALIPTVSLFHSTYQHCLHRIDLTPSLETLFRNCHKSSTQRKIRRAERERLVYEEGRSKTHLDIFFRLLLLTRRRHQLPPQPKSWFKNLIECFGESVKIRVALKDRQPVASILTMQYKDTLVYKYGCSDEQFNDLGGMHLLLWKSIEEAKQQGLCVMDLGRTTSENTGLITFKDRWGSTRSTLKYVRFAVSADSSGHFVPAGADWRERAAKRIFSRLPDRVLCLVGNVIYKHIG
jgi:CelD/BcsL family acetyltransferase involved in cellulose biosynthesis